MFYINKDISLKPTKRRPYSIVLVYFTALTLTSFAIAGTLLYAYHREQTQSLTRSLEMIAGEIVRLNLYRDDPESVKKSFELVNRYGHIPHEGLTFAYHPEKPKPVKGVGVVKKLPDGRYLTLYSSLKHVNEKTWALSTKAAAVFATVLLVFAFAFGLFLKKKERK